MGRRPCCAKEGLNRGTWTVREDKILTDYINIHGEGKWRDLPLKAGLKRCGKSCRLRWLNYLRPDIKRGNISPEEDELIVRLHKLLGNRCLQCWRAVLVQHQSHRMCFQRLGFYLDNGRFGSTKYQDEFRIIENTSDDPDDAPQAALQGVLPAPSLPNSKVITASSRGIRSLPSNMLRVSFNLCQQLVAGSPPDLALKF